MNIRDILAMAPVIPVLVIDDLAHAKPIAEVLVAAGLPVMEVTLRTESASQAIAAMTQVPGAVVGASTVVFPEQLEDVADAGARFIVSPGLSEAIADAALKEEMPYLPGVATAADLMRGLEYGFDRFNFFPAVASGGIAALNALAPPFFQCRFCPTGGIAQDNAADWLALPHVACVGGTWVVPKGPPDLGLIYDRAVKASRLRND